MWISRRYVESSTYNLDIFSNTTAVSIQIETGPLHCLRCSCCWLQVLPGFLRPMFKCVEMNVPSPASRTDKEEERNFSHHRITKSHWFMLTPTLYVHSPSLYHPPTFFLHCVFFCRYLIFNHIFIVLVNPRPTHTTLTPHWHSLFKHFLSQMGFKWKSMIHSTSCPTPGSKAQSICKIISQRSHHYWGSHSQAQLRLCFERLAKPLRC